jgi:hypothetical protein
MDGAVRRFVLAGLVAAAAVVTTPAEACTYFPGYVTISGVAVATPSVPPWDAATTVDLTGGRVEAVSLRPRRTDPEEFLESFVVGAAVEDLQFGLDIASQVPFVLYRFGQYTLTMTSFRPPTVWGPGLSVRGTGWFEGDGYRTKTFWDLDLLGDRYYADIRGAPEPAGALLLGLGVLAAFVRRRRR